MSREGKYVLCSEQIAVLEELDMGHGSVLISLYVRYSTT